LLISDGKEVVGQRRLVMTPLQRRIENSTEEVSKGSFGSESLR